MARTHQRRTARLSKARSCPTGKPSQRRFEICAMSEGRGAKPNMPIEITVPRLGWTMEEGTFVGWLKKDGESVRAGEPLFTLDGDKAIQEIEASDSGILRIALDAPKPGSTVRVGAVLGYLVTQEEGERFRQPSPSASVTSEAARPAVEPISPPPEPGPGEKSLPPVVASEKPAISPRALRAAAELGVDWQGLQGTGRTGRIRERDVLAAGQAKPSAIPRPKITFSLKDKITVVTGAASGIGAAIAEAFADA